MSNFLRYITIFSLMMTALSASPAREGIILFTQPDGTQFKGYLRGDSAFNWIESDSKIIMFNSKDKFYYITKVNANGNLECTNTKPTEVTSVAQSIVKKSTSGLDQKLVKALKQMRNSVDKGNHPR